MAAIPPNMLIRFHLLQSGTRLLDAVIDLRSGDPTSVRPLFSFGYHLGRIHRLMVTNFMFQRFETPSYLHLAYSQPFNVEDAYTMMVTSMSIIDQGFAVGFIRESMMLNNIQLIDTYEWHRPYIKAFELKDFAQIKKILLDEISAHVQPHVQPVTFRVVFPAMLDWKVIEHEVEMELLQWKKL
jgi:hypothetical protein